MKKTKLLISVVTFIVFLSSLALANGLNLNSLGSRALAMGGAFVGLADDFSAIFWNPAGIAQFNQQYFGFYGTGIMPSGKYKMEVPVPGVGTMTLVNAQTKSKTYLGGLAAYYYPVTEKMVAGFGVYSPSGLGANWDGADFAAISEGETTYIIDGKEVKLEAIVGYSCQKMRKRKIGWEEPHLPRAVPPFPDEYGFDTIAVSYTHLTLPTT